MSAGLAGLAGLLALTLGFTAPATAQGQGVLMLVDRRVSPGAAVSLTGVRFPPGSAVALALEGAGGRAALGSVTTGPAGTFSESLRVPANLAPGAYRLVARAGGATLAGLDVAVLADTSAPAAPEDHSAAATPMAEGMSHPAAEASAVAADSDAAVAASGRSAGWTVMGYDWPQLHAALNDLPAALLLVTVAFEILALLTRRPSLRAAGFWTLLVGLAGMIAAAGAGLLAEGVVEHDDVAHEVMQRHKTLALVTLGLFTVLAIWRVARRNVDNRREQMAWSAVAAGGLALLVVAAQLGGRLTFDHAMGLRSATLRDVLERRGEMPALQPMDSAGGDTTTAPTVRPHRDAPGAAPHSHAKRPAGP